LFIYAASFCSVVHCLSLHDALPIYGLGLALIAAADVCRLVSRHDKLDLAALFDGGEERGANLYTRMRYVRDLCSSALFAVGIHRSEEHTSELQSRFDLVCRLLLEKK